MESWVVGYDGDDDVERHADVVQDSGEPEPPVSKLRIRVISDYI
jgi:hypothetical protein